MLWHDTLRSSVPKMSDTLWWLFRSILGHIVSAGEILSMSLGSMLTISAESQKFVTSRLMGNWFAHFNCLSLLVHNFWYGARLDEFSGGHCENGYLITQVCWCCWLIVMFRNRSDVVRLFSDVRRLCCYCPWMYSPCLTHCVLAQHWLW